MQGDGQQPGWGGPGAWKKGQCVQGGMRCGCGAEAAMLAAGEAS